MSTRVPMLLRIANETEAASGGPTEYVAAVRAAVEAMAATRSETDTVNAFTEELPSRGTRRGIVITMKVADLDEAT